MRSKRGKSFNESFNKNKMLLIPATIIIFSILIMSGMIQTQSSFVINQEAARFYLNGISYNGMKYLDSSAFTSGLSGGQVFAWTDNKISVDVDGVQKLTTSSRTGIRTGMKPDINFEITKTPYLVDISGNAISSGYTSKTQNSEGKWIYEYDYKTELQISSITAERTFAELQQDGMVGGAGTIEVLLPNGAIVKTSGIIEFDVVNNIFALISIDPPELIGWNFNWEGSISDSNIKFIFSKTGNEFTEGSYGQYLIDNYPERLTNVVYEYSFRFNVNSPQKPSHSINGRISLVNVNGELIGSIGMDSISIPGAYNGYYAGWLWTYFAYEWVLMKPVYTYTLTLKCFLTEGDGTTTTPTTTTTTSTDPQWPGFQMNTEMKLIIGGVGAGFGLLVLVFTIKKRGISMGGGGYYG